MEDIKIKWRDIVYPVKIGFNDGSGMDEFWITDKLDTVLIHGQGDCCKIGGIQDKITADAIVSCMNKLKPKFKISYYARDNE